MKKIVTLATMLLLFAAYASAATVNFAWDPNTEIDLAGYRLYQSFTYGEYSAMVAEISAGVETVELSGVVDGTYFWVLTAFDSSGNESGPSNEVALTIDSTPPAPPSGFLGWIKQIIAWVWNLFGWA